MSSATGPGKNTTRGAAAGALVGWCAPLVLVIIAAVAFLPALGAEFLNWDDPGNITKNDHYRGLGAEQIRWAFTTFHMGHYQPLSWLTLGLDYVIWGMEPFGYHLTNLLLHICNALLVYVLAIRLYGMAGCVPAAKPEAASRHPSDRRLMVGAFVAAGLFAVHPLRVESVAWVTERRDVLSVALYLLTVHLYLTARAQPGRAATAWWTVGALTVFTLALSAKVMSVSLIPVLLILDVYPLGRLGGGKGWFRPGVLGVWVEKLPFVVPGLAASFIAFMAQGQATSLVPWGQHGLLPRLAACAYGLVFYVYKTVWPVVLSPLWELPTPLRPFEPRYLVCAAAVVAGIALVMAARRRWPAAGSALAAAALAYVIILLPVLGLFQNGPQLVASRYSYLSCIGWVLLIGACCCRAWRRWASRARRASLAGVAGAIIAVLAALTWQENKTWCNSLSLWDRAIRVDPNCVFCHENYAEALVQAGASEQAIEVYRRALELRPRAKKSLVGLATQVGQQGRVDEALELYARALEVAPDYAGAHYNLALLLSELGEQDQAMQHYRSAIACDPQEVRAYLNLGNLLSEAKRLDEAVEVYRQGLAVKPRAARICRNLGFTLARRGDFTGAEEQIRRALELRPGDAEAWNNLGFILEKLKRPEEAAQAYGEALRLRPDYGRAHTNLGLLLARAGRPVEATDHFRQALRAAPELVEVRLRLAALLAEQDRCTEAVALLREGLVISPGHTRLADRLKQVSASCGGKKGAQAEGTD